MIDKNSTKGCFADEENSQINIGGIDYLRIILAFLITVLHIKPTLSMNADVTFYLTHAITRTAVPGFFFITGYLYGIKGKSFGEWDTASRHMKRMFVLYCTWTAMCLPLIVHDFIINPKYEEMSVLYMMAIFVRRFFLIGSWTPLWFFLAGTYATFILFVLIRAGLSKSTVLIIMGFSAFIGACLNDCYTPVGVLFLALMKN